MHPDSVWRLRRQHQSGSILANHSPYHTAEMQDRPVATLSDKGKMRYEDTICIGDGTRWEHLGYIFSPSFCVLCDSHFAYDVEVIESKVSCLKYV